jgi:RHS repeat-associated protein
VYVRSSGTLFIGDTLFCDTLVVDSGGLVTHYQSGRFTPKSLAIVADYINVKSGGTVDVSGKGFPAGYTIGGDTASTWQRSGGSHGGMGGGTSAATYDSYLTPCLPGGGGTYPGSPINNAGGGAVRIITRQMQLDGAIVADGLALGWEWGSGAGGSIWVSADSIRGSGRMVAQGPNPGGDPMTNREGKLGGGGRIAVYCPNMNGVFLNNFSVSGNQPGTIYLERSRFAPIVFDGGAGGTSQISILPYDTLFTNRNIIVQRGANLSFQGGIQLGSVQVRTRGNLEFRADAAVDTLTIDSATVSLKDDTLKAGEIQINGGGVLTHLPTTFSFEEPDSLVTWNGHVYGCFKQNSPNWQYAEKYAKKRGGHLVTINDAAEAQFLATAFPMPSWTGLFTKGAANDASGYRWVSGASTGYTNWKSGQPDVKSGSATYAIMGYDFGTSQWHNVENTGWNGKPVYGIFEVNDPDSLKVYQPTFNKAIIVCDHIRIYPNASIDVSGKGYPAGFTANADSLTLSAVAGGSHAGKGNGSTARMYGNYAAPELPGGGGGTPASGKAGGGVLRLSSRVLQVEGSIKADGIDADNTGAGAGGSIWISSDTIVGDGSITANGGRGYPYGSGLQAGGGRVAVYGKRFFGTIRNNVAASGYSSGTIFLFDSLRNVFGTLILDNKGTVSPDSSTIVTSIGTGSISYLTADTVRCDTCRFPVYHKETSGLRGLTINVNPLTKVDLSTQFKILWNDSTRIVVDTSGGRSLRAKTGVGGAIEGLLNLDTIRVRGGARGFAKDPVIYDRIDINSGSFSDPAHGVQTGGLHKLFGDIRMALIGNKNTKALSLRRSGTVAMKKPVTGPPASPPIPLLQASGASPEKVLHDGKDTNAPLSVKKRLSRGWEEYGYIAQTQCPSAMLSELKRRVPSESAMVSKNTAPSPGELLMIVKRTNPQRAAMNGPISELEGLPALLEKYRKVRCGDSCPNRRPAPCQAEALPRMAVVSGKNDNHQGILSTKRNVDNNSAGAMVMSRYGGRGDHGPASASGGDTGAVRDPAFVSRFIDRERRMKEIADGTVNDPVVRLACAGKDPVYTYDALNRRTSMTTPWDTTYYDYNAATGRLSAIRKSDGRKFDFTYNRGQLTSMAMPNGVKASYAFDDNGNLTAIDYDKGASRIAQFHYGYDPDGMRTSMTDNDGRHDYWYDALYQIVKATHPRVQDPLETFRYDSVGNRLEDRGGSAYRYDNLNHLLEDNTSMYAYDRDGNMTRKINKSAPDTTVYTWSIENKLIQVDLGLSKTTFTYDALGRRVAKVHDGIVHEYRYDGEDLLAEFNANDSIIAAWTFGPGIDRPLEMKRGSQKFYYIIDGLGSVSALTDAVVAVMQKYKYGVFGNMGVDSGSVENPFRYTAREWDGEVGLYYYRARFYDAGVGRFVSEDPIKFKRPDVNFYKVILNDPINLIDPTGLYGENSNESNGVTSTGSFGSKEIYPWGHEPQPPTSENDPNLSLSGLLGKALWKDSKTRDIICERLTGYDYKDLLDEYKNSSLDDPSWQQLLVNGIAIGYGLNYGYNYIRNGGEIKTGNITISRGDNHSISINGNYDIGTNDYGINIRVDAKW